jgi:hypothetical protein
MITTTAEGGTALPARDLPRIFSNDTRCTWCQSAAIRVRPEVGCHDRREPCELGSAERRAAQEQLN